MYTKAFALILKKKRFSNIYPGTFQGNLSTLTARRHLEVSENGTIVIDC